MRSSPVEKGDRHLATRQFREFSWMSLGASPLFQQATSRLYLMDTSRTPSTCSGTNSRACGSTCPSSMKPRVCFGHRHGLFVFTRPHGLFGPLHPTFGYL